MLAVILSDWFSKKQKALKNSSATEREREREREWFVCERVQSCVFYTGKVNRVFAGTALGVVSDYLGLSI